MAKKLSMGLLAIVLCSSTAWAQEASLPESSGTPETETPDNQADGNSTFQLFQHGIWHPENPLQPVPKTSAVHDGARTNLQKRKLTRLSRTTSSRRSIYLTSIRAAERKHALPFGLLDALIWQESRYNPMAVSPAGAVSLAQLMPGTASDLGVSYAPPVEGQYGAAPALTDRMTRLDVPGDLALPIRPQTFFDRTSCKICLSRLRSATNRLSCRFSSSNCLSRLNSPTPSPP